RAATTSMAVRMSATGARYARRSLPPEAAASGPMRWTLVGCPTNSGKNLLLHQPQGGPAEVGRGAAAEGVEQEGSGGADVGDGVVGGHDAVATGGPDVVDGGDVDDGAGPGLVGVGVPGGIGDGVAEEVGAEAVPGGVGVGVDEGGGQGVVAAAEEQAGLTAQRGALVAVEPLEVAAAFGHHAEAQPGGPADGGRGAAADEEEGAAGGAGPWGDRGAGASAAGDGAAGGHHRVAGPGSPEQVDGGVEAGGPLVHRDAEEVELLLAVAGAEDHRQAAAAQDVEDGELLGGLHRVAEGGEEGGHLEGDPGGPGGDGGGHHQGGREVAVGGAVVLGEQHRQAAAGGVGPGGHVEG